MIGGNLEAFLLLFLILAEVVGGEGTGAGVIILAFFFLFLVLMPTSRGTEGWTNGGWCWWDVGSSSGGEMGLGTLSTGGDLPISSEVWVWGNLLDRFAGRFCGG